MYRTTRRIGTGSTASAAIDFVDLGACKVEPILREMEKTSGVAIRSHTLYATGICADCATLAASDDKAR